MLVPIKSVIGNKNRLSGDDRGVVGNQIFMAGKFVSDSEREP